MKALTNEQLEAKIAQRKKVLAEFEERFKKQKKRQEDKENKETVSLVRSHFQSLDVFKAFLERKETL